MRGTSRWTAAGAAGGLLLALSWGLAARPAQPAARLAQPAARPAQPAAPAAGPAEPVAAPTAPAIEAAAPPAPPQDAYHRVPYNARFTFTRVRYGGDGDLRRWRRGGSAWAHDWPDGDRNLQRILAEFTAVDANPDGSNVFTLEDPEIFRHPILYVSEPGFWTESDAGARNLRSWLLKGGFLILDDFEGRQWDNMAVQIARALPEGRWREIDGTHPVFQSFFAVEDIYVPHPLVAVTPRYLAIFEDDDPSRRIMVLANHNADLAEYWEYAARGWFPMDPTNDAFRLGVNYVVYGLTH